MYYNCTFVHMKLMHFIILFCHIASSWFPISETQQEWSCSWQDTSCNEGFLGGEQKERLESSTMNDEETSSTYLPSLHHREPELYHPYSNYEWLSPLKGAWHGLDKCPISKGHVYGIFRLPPYLHIHGIISFIFNNKIFLIF